MINPFKEIDSIDFLDLGCSGSLDSKWKDIFKLLSYIGFDINITECERLSNQRHPYKKAQYFPYAIAGNTGIQKMYKTNDVYCFSLLPPNQLWLRRFSFSDLFELAGTENIQCNTLDDLSHELGLKADIIKLDTQGLELPILMSSNSILNNVFCVETETGFVENYLGETTFSQIDEFMRSKGFLMFDLKYHRIGRANNFNNTGKHQPLWCEALWLYDFINNDKIPERKLAIKSLVICRTLKFYDYGMELAYYFHQNGIISLDELRYLKKFENWTSKSDIIFHLAKSYFRYSKKLLAVIKKLT
jgi:FkbM family methyltransferase